MRWWWVLTNCSNGPGTKKPEPTRVDPGYPFYPQIWLWFSLVLEETNTIPGRSSDFPVYPVAFPLSRKLNSGFSAGKHSLVKERDHSGGPVPDLHGVPFSSA